MNLNDLRNNLVYWLGTLLAGMLVAILILGATPASAASILTEQYRLDGLESPYDSSSYQYSFTRDFIPMERSNLIDNLIKNSEDCPRYISLLEKFVSCSPGLSDTELLSESNDSQQISPGDTGQSS